MGNLAHKKLPIEKDSWKNPEEATNGNITNYNGKNGFAHAYHPCNYTINLENEHRVSVVRFLLWDNLGATGNKVKATREYTFSLSVSYDGTTFITLYSNQNQKGGNGWYSFHLPNDTYARYVRLTGHSNTENRAFHIVEFEIHDEIPPDPKSANLHKMDIATGLGIPSVSQMEELVEKALLAKSKEFEGLDNKIKQLDDYLRKSGESLDLLEIIRQSKEYRDEADDNNRRAKRWLITSGFTLVTFLILLIWFIFCDSKAEEIINDTSYNPTLSPYTPVLLGAFYIAKAVLLSTILFLLGWFLKSYRSEKHNYVINQHKSMTLTVATAILTKEEYKNTDRGNIFNQAMDIIFTHQASGFSKDESGSPSIISTILQKRSTNTDGII